MRWPIRAQLLAPLLVVLLGDLITSVGTAITSVRQAQRHIEARLREVARLLSESSRFRLTTEVLRQMRPLVGAEFVVLNVSEEGLLSGLPGLPTESGDVGDPPTSSLPADLVPELPIPLEIREDWKDLRLGPAVQVGLERYRYSAIRLRRWPNESAVLIILYPERVWRDAVWEATWPSVIFGGILGLLSLLLALLLSTGLARRIHSLERRTRLIAAGDFSPMPLPRRKDELLDLTRSVNEMASRLAQYQETVRRTERMRLLGQVSTGLAHQLRNGLTGARLAVQLYRQEVEANRSSRGDASAGSAGSVEQDLSPLEVALRELTLLETHLKRFLDLGHAGHMRREPCDLLALMRQTLELLVPRCRHAGIELVVNVVDSAVNVPLWGDPGQLGQLLLNLISNAIDATEGQLHRPLGQGKVEVRVRREIEDWIVEVLDNGPGPPPELAERLFEPFVTGKPEGVGLGLAVSRQIAEAHGVQLHWTRVEGRTCFRLLMPHVPNAPNV